MLQPVGHSFVLRFECQEQYSKLTYSFLAISSVQSANNLIFSPGSRVRLFKPYTFLLVPGIIGYHMVFEIRGSKFSHSFYFQVVSVNTNVVQGLLRLLVSWCFVFFNLCSMIW